MKFDLMTALITLMMILLISAYAIFNGIRIFKFFSLQKKEMMIYVSGRVIKRINEKELMRGSKRATISIPLIKINYKGKNYEVESMLYYPDVEIGNNIKVGVYENKKGGVEFWIVQDMKRARIDYFKKIILLILLTVIMILVSLIK